MGNRRSACALKHERFCLALLSGMTAADAARSAGYGRKPANVRIIAWELLNKRKDVQRRLAQLSAIATNEGVMTIIERKIALSDMIRANDRPLECIELMNKMDGLYRGEKKESSTSGITIVTVDKGGE